MRNRTVAAFMALFGGSFGLHKFYLRTPGPGIIYLMLLFMSIRIFAMPLSAILGIIDAMRLFMMTDREFDKKYNPEMAGRERRQSRTSRDPRSRRATPQASNKRQRANPFKKSGIRKYKEYDLDEAIVDFQKGLEIEPDDLALHFNIACAYSLTEQKDMAFDHLSKAVKLGFKDFDKISTHDDLAYLRIQPEFEAFKADGYQLKQTTEQKGDITVNKDDRLLAQLNKLKDLREKGIISEADYNYETKKILRR